MDTLFCQNTQTLNINNAAEMSQAFHIALFKCFTDPNLLKPFKN